VVLRFAEEGVCMQGQRETDVREKNSTVLKGETLKIESGKEVIARYKVKTDYL
jgi:hypothetical protein